MNKHSWRGKSILDPKHEEGLELSAAIHEFHHGHDRATAEQLAFDEYQRKNHSQAAAHHLQGIKAAQSDGNTEDAKKHYAMYVQHIKALGHKEYDPVPPEVKQHIESDKPVRAYRFKSHAADALTAT